MSMFFSQGQHKSWKSSEIVVGNTSGNIRPFTNKEYTNSTTTNHNRPRPLKQYRRGRDVLDSNSRFVRSSTSGALIKQLVDIPGGASVTTQQNLNCSVCNGIGFVGNEWLTSSLSDTPHDETQTPLFCCNEEQTAIDRCLPSSSLLALNSVVVNSKTNITEGIVTNKYYMRLDQYRQGRCLTYDQRSFNFVSKVPTRLHEYIVKCNSVNQTCDVAVYKPNNQQYAQQGAVKSSVRTFKKKVTTIETAKTIHAKSFDGTNSKKCCIVIVK